MLATLLLIVAAYLLGSVPFGYVFGRLAGIDVRTIGSGNIGAANVVRALGRRRGALTLVADSAKGFLPVYIAWRLGLGEMELALTAVAAFLGHLFSVFLGFHGGKGVATALGVLMAVAPMAAFSLLILFAAVVFISRIVSLGAIAAAVATPLFLWLFYQPPVMVLMGVFLGVMVILRHRDNIQRLLAGTESRFTFR